MSDYDINDVLNPVAQSCKSFSSNRQNGRISGPHEGVSCGICRNWHGNRCAAGTFDSLLTGLDQI